MNRIEKSIQRQLDTNRSKNPLYTRFDRLIEIDPEFLAALEELVERGPKGLTPRALEEAVSFASEALLRRVHVVNQFVHVDRTQRARLEEIYRRSWRRIVKTRNIQAALVGCHYPALSRWLANLYPDEFRAVLRDRPTVGCVVCAEYQPQVQLDLLRLDPDEVLEPVLDIGCGSKAALVHHLRSLGIDAQGIDRHVDRGGSYVKQADWLDYDFRPGAWGTLISNMSFSNHLQYARRYDSRLARTYLAKYREIVESLKPGGTLAYAPSLPFVEKRLSDDMQVVRFPVVSGINATHVTRRKRSKQA